MADLTSLGIAVPTVLLPAPTIDYRKWAVIAADQYTSQLDYWERVDRFVGNAPSTLRLFLPEVYLGRADVDERIARIQAAMREYERSAVFREPWHGFIYIDRSTSHSASRKGLIVALDLEHYEYRPGATSLIRATEKTVEERLPSRVRVRRGATLELPHVMVLLDDPDRSVIEPLAALCERDPLYTAELMEGGGSLRGFGVSAPEAIETVRSALSRLADPGTFQKRYGITSSDVMLFAVGDGNHSLAAAKVHWEELKSSLPEASASSHPARYALVELVNVHDPGLQFEPIHRVVFDVDADALLEALPKYIAERGGEAQIATLSSDQEQHDRLKAAWAGPGGVQAFGFLTKERRGLVQVSAPPSNLPVGTLQSFLDDSLSAWPGATIDYIHGADVLGSLSREPGRIGFLLPAMSKRELFKTVLVDGALPRKTFSMGEAEEKRFYFEARRIMA